ncbi:RNA polymerase RpoN-/SigL-like sigma 54 subunit [Scopulibacillus darangshiensis]|uniref:RNA polymerase RpoN-/SigL-like sigma 54 subunit n=1 Tax=Scopulibacillus darangshiensis TaxID=442528 RepID=A0A4R2NSJ4_9BACL|nr:RNA polymerase factor sigma-54 [Scopulibacillus darangshiensis]TCP24860.1 RNA polymerase RpoN-/SigL-like sigma 54 subunit [Scopulibacillus darangshiensis]
MALDMMQTQTLKLKMAPALYQSISLLQYNNQELYHFVREQALENPLLQVDDSPYTPVKSTVEWHSDKSKTDIIEETATGHSDFRDVLFTQLRHITKDQNIIKAAAYLIDSLNDYGYLDEPLELLADDLNLDESIMEQALEVIQQFEPAGVGARDLQECLLLQLSNNVNSSEVAEDIVRDFIDVFLTEDWETLADQLQVPLEDIHSAVEEIKSLDPNPVGELDQKPVEYVSPDVIIDKVEGRFYCTMADRWFPNVTIDLQYYKNYRSADDRETRRFLQKKLDEAKWLLSGLSRRKQTLLAVTEAIVHRQHDFLKNGVLEMLTPMTLTVIADDLGIHESTVSRTVKNKYIQTPYGLMALKDWFVKGMRAAGGDISVHRIKSLIEQMISFENPAKPLSDQNIATQLAEKGLNISRRAVAKYRGECGIQSSSKRKRKEK